MIQELKFLVQLLSPLYRPPAYKAISFPEVDLENLLKIAEQNNLLYYTAQILRKNYFNYITAEHREKINKIISNGQVQLQKIDFALNLLNKNFNNLLLVKTYRNYPRLANDLDILTKNFIVDMAKLKDLNLQASDYDPKLQEVIFYQDKIAKIHLHGSLSWQNRLYFDNDLIWQQPKTILLGQQEIAIPNPTADWLIHLAHMNFEPLHFTLSELLYLFNLTEQIDKKVIMQQSKKYHWHHALIKTLHILNNFHNYFYHQPLLVNNIIPPTKLITHADSDYQLPKSFSRWHIITAFLAKGIIIQPLIKINKVIKILITGNARKGFYQAPENNLLK
ncbi:MAG: hypothetical protein A2Y82_02345 [Candidatus Buchananbacteria bacterium RBG_13_36_9]|uniref:Uncharacterized protein n=1 Tax=Candidatus Buchananbacteria bacterium RBG_13_36_9 TaxID=1797530 RepID=A0A1G1XP17_9BACT|nr:MAG: hypothetical protein A2Y82_02345 [Candidatus Buchananbacteria bacterium RBG_13_36_9]